MTIRISENSPKYVNIAPSSETVYWKYQTEAP